MQTKSNLQNNYEDYSSGRVIYSGSGATNFPVRLSNQIFEMCKTHLYSNGNKGPYKIYDPFCGFAYTLTTLGFIYPSDIKELYASDIDEKSLEFASKNLTLLSNEGINKRIAELEELIFKFDKESHKAALASAYKLKAQLNRVNIKTTSFKQDILIQTSLPEFINNIDLVIVDLPYGKLAQWANSTAQDNNCQTFLHNISNHLGAISIVAITSDKKQLIEHQGYERIKKFNIGKRRTILLRKIN
ncbi:MAG TPA: hypothetical protein VK983_05685 [Candidatus Limnocylindrales bacterium]|nr:hypothetical protein [Candidatus Limnocylindrales bacterium]